MGLEKYVDEIIITMANITKEEKKKIIEKCQETKCKLKTLPGMYEIIDGKVDIKKIRDVEIKDIDELKGYLEENHIDMGILCVPRINAQKVCDVLVNGGVRGIWNFAPIDLHVPETVKVENVHLSESLLTLVYLMKDN